MELKITGHYITVLPTYLASTGYVFVTTSTREDLHLADGIICLFAMVLMKICQNSFNLLVLKDKI